MSTGTDIARTELMVKGGDSSPFETILTAALEASPFNEDNADGLKKHYQSHPSRYVDDLVKLRSNLPQYGGTVPVNTTNNLILNLGELGLSQKEKLLAEKLAELGITKEMLQEMSSIGDGTTRIQEEAGRGDSNSESGSGGEGARPPVKLQSAS